MRTLCVERREARAHGLLLLGLCLQQLLDILVAAEDALLHPRHEPLMPLLLELMSTS
jgi:hypothetical protein